MLHYPKIPGSQNCPDGQCIAFEKYDGTNLHWEWDRELGWHSFGTRRDAFELDAQGQHEFAVFHEHLHEAPPLFLTTLARPLVDVFLSRPHYAAAQNISVFTEFCGAASFAGLHQPLDPKSLWILDVMCDGCFVAPNRFVDDFGHLSTARVVYRGRLTGAFAEGVRRGEYDVTEGVVCKGGVGRDVWRVKIKTTAYLERLQAAFASNWEDYWE